MVSYLLISASAVLQMPSFPSTDFHLNCRKAQFLGRGAKLSSDPCDCHPIDLAWQNCRRFECWEDRGDTGDYRNNCKNLPDKKKRPGSCVAYGEPGFCCGMLNTHMACTRV